MEPEAGAAGLVLLHPDFTYTTPGLQGDRLVEMMPQHPAPGAATPQGPADPGQADPHPPAPFPAPPAGLGGELPAGNCGPGSPPAPHFPSAVAPAENYESQVPGAGGSRGRGGGRR